MLRKIIAHCLHNY